MTWTLCKDRPPGEEGSLPKPYWLQSAKNRTDVRGKQGWVAGPRAGTGASRGSVVRGQGLCAVGGDMEEAHFTFLTALARGHRAFYLHFSETGKIKMLSKQKKQQPTK